MNILKNPKVLGAGVVGLIIVAFLAFGVFGIQTAFTDDEVSEANPFAESAGESGRAEDVTSAELAADMNDAMEGVEAVTADEEMPEMEAEILTLGEGNFEGRSHPTSGIAKVLSDGDVSFLRFEEFVTDNGPDLNVYLSAAPLGADSGEYDDDFIDLGDLKGNIGEQNYELPAGIDLEKYNTVVIWCVRFGVAFGASSLNA